MSRRPKPHVLTLALFAAGLIGPLHAQTTINANTDYNGQGTGGSNFSGQVLTAGAADLGTTTIRFVDARNTTWSASPTGTPAFNGFGSQGFRQTDFSGADWHGITFTSGTSGNQFFLQANFTNANFSGTTFNLIGGPGNNESFKEANFSGADFSNTYINVGTQTNFWSKAIFSSSTNFSGATIMAGNDSSRPASLNGADFSNATLRINLEGTDLSHANFRNTVFIPSSTIRNSVANQTDFRGTDFSGLGFANWLPSLTWDAGNAPIYDASTIFTTQSGTFDPVAAGWALIPEPASSALICGGLFAGFAILRRKPRHTLQRSLDSASSA